MIDYFMMLILSIVIAIVYYAANRKALDIGSILIASFACYAISYALIALTLRLCEQLPRYVAEGVLFFVPLILGIDIPLLAIAIRFARSR